MQLKDPVPDTVSEQLPIEAPAEIEAETVAPGVKPLPEIVTETPVGPWLGVSVTVGAVIVNAVSV